MMAGISGFPEYLPEQQQFFTNTIRTIQYIFEHYGFVAMDTPLVERTETVLAKGDAHEIYGLHRIAESESHDKTKLALRFDLTVPLARYVAQHQSKLTFPYRRYHIGPVFRGERPQKGRYRQFYQCDIDTIGAGVLSPEYEAEILYTAFHTLNTLNITPLSIEVNNRKILSGLFQSWGITEALWNDLLRVLDKVEKISQDAWWEALSGFNIPESGRSILDTFKHQQWSLEMLQRIEGGNIYHQGVKELAFFVHQAERFGVPLNVMRINPLLARGLTYYTGNLCEAKWLDHPELGTICAGGRYDNLVQSATEKPFPGFGLSIGISRLMEALYASQYSSFTAKTSTQIFITKQNECNIDVLWHMAQQLRNSGICTEVAFMNDTLRAQMKYAQQKRIAYVLIQHAEAECWELKHMNTGEQYPCSAERLVEDVKRFLRLHQIPH